MKSRRDDPLIPYTECKPRSVSNWVPERAEITRKALSETPTGIGLGFMYVPGDV
jgi:hypothetical protein